MESSEDYSGLEELLQIEESLENYNHDLVSKLQRGQKFANVDNCGEKVLDFGAGTGTLAEIWRDTFQIVPTCVEIDAKCQSILKKKGFSTITSLKDLENLSQTHIYTSNVLEHIENDREVLLELFAKIKKGGVLSIYVPALPKLYSELDRKVGHFRRYKKRELIKKVQEAGFDVALCEWNDCLGILGSIAMKVFGYKSDGVIGGRKSLLLYDKIIYPISRVLDSIILRKIVGKNLIVHAVKKVS